MKKFLLSFAPLLFVALFGVAVGPAHATGCNLMVTGPLNVRTSIWGEVSRTASAGESFAIVELRSNAGEIWASAAADQWLATWTASGHLEGSCSGLESSADSRSEVSPALPVASGNAITLYNASGGVIVSANIDNICPVVRPSWDTTNAWDAPCRLAGMTFPQHCLGIAGHSVYDDGSYRRVGVFAPLLSNAATTATVSFNGQVYEYSLTLYRVSLYDISHVTNCGRDGGLLVQYSVEGTDADRFVLVGTRQ